MPSRDADSKRLFRKKGAKLIFVWSCYPRSHTTLYALLPQLVLTFHFLSLLMSSSALIAELHPESALMDELRALENDPIAALQSQSGLTNASRVLLRELLEAAKLPADAILEGHLFPVETDENRYKINAHKDAKLALLVLASKAIVRALIPGATPVLNFVNAFRLCPECAKGRPCSRSIWLGFVTHFDNTMVNPVLQPLLKLCAHDKYRQEEGRRPTMDLICRALALSEQVRSWHSEFDALLQKSTAAGSPVAGSASGLSSAASPGASSCPTATAPSADAAPRVAAARGVRWSDSAAEGDFDLPEIAPAGSAR